MDGTHTEHCLEIEKLLYEAFSQFELDDLSFFNEADRHYERSEQSEASLNRRAARHSETVEDAVFHRLECEALHSAINELPEIQRRRLILYYFGELTYEQIAEMEGCTKRAVKFSVDGAIKKIKEKI